jgi:hypothetical protein
VTAHKSGSGGAQTALPLLSTTFRLDHTTLTSEEMVGGGIGGIEILAAPGAGKILLCPAISYGFAFIHADTTGGAYTIASGALWAFYLDGTADGANWAGAHDVLSFGAPNMQPLMPAAALKGTGSPTPIAGIINDDAPTDLLDKRLLLSLAGSGIAQLTGGDPANYCDVTVYYAVLDLT